MKNRAFRGGSWILPTWRCRASDRFRDAPGNRYISLGFRVLRRKP